MDSSKQPDGQDQQQVDAQAREQTGQRRVQLRINDSQMQSSYANAFRTNMSAEEVIIDFGMNITVPAPPTAQDTANGSGDGHGAQAAGEIRFDVNERIIMNYYTTKRLALMLGQVIRRHEDQFGELKLNAAERTKY
jgi:hypothetical protein